MRYHTISPISMVAVITAVALACDGSRVPTAPGQLGEEIVGRSSAASLVPFKGTFSAIGTAADVPGDRCPALTVHIEGTGTATHLGSLTTVQSHCVEPSSFAFTNGQFTITAANGDQLFGIYQGEFLPLEPPVFTLDEALRTSPRAPRWSCSRGPSPASARASRQTPRGGSGPPLHAHISASRQQGGDRGPPIRAELVQHVLGVVLRRAQADAQSRGDVVVGESFREEPRDLGLARRQAEPSAEVVGLDSALAQALEREENPRTVAEHCTGQDDSAQAKLRPLREHLKVQHDRPAAVRVPGLRSRAQAAGRAAELALELGALADGRIRKTLQERGRLVERTPIGIGYADRESKRVQQARLTLRKWQRGHESNHRAG
jgi:hypothetical protein